MSFSQTGQASRVRCAIDPSFSPKGVSCLMSHVDGMKRHPSNESLDPGMCWTTRCSLSQNKIQTAAEKSERKTLSSPTHRNVCFVPIGFNSVAWHLPGGCSDCDRLAGKKTRCSFVLRRRPGPSSCGILAHRQWRHDRSAGISLLWCVEHTCGVVRCGAVRCGAVLLRSARPPSGDW